MPYAADYALADILGVAGATVALIIAGAILLGGLEAKYTHLFERYRGLTGEYRRAPGDSPRHEGLRVQILNYRLRLRMVNIACLCMGSALAAFILTVAIASLSVVYPGALALRAAGTWFLLGGFLLAAFAIILDVGELLHSRSATLPEVDDLDGIDSERQLFS